MKPLAEQTHYEVLEISSDAGMAEIERAYRLVHTTYQGDSLATYSLLDADDAKAICERVESAYQVLSNQASRRAYDRFIAGETPSESAASSSQSAAPAAAPSSLASASSVIPESPAAPEPEAPPPAPAIAEAGAPEESGEFDGACLRRARLRCGIEVEQVASITRISPIYLAMLEEERFDQLPASVYVRGFGAAYARCIGLDPERVANGYMTRLEGVRSAQRRGWLLGRH